MRHQIVKRMMLLANKKRLLTVMYIAHIDTASTLSMSDYPLDLLDPRTSSSDSASCTARIRKRDKFREFCPPFFYPLRSIRVHKSGC